MTKQLQKPVKIINAKLSIFMQMNVLWNDDFAFFGDSVRLCEKYEYKRKGNSCEQVEFGPRSHI